MEWSPFLELLFYGYFVVFAATAISVWLFLRKRDPMFRWRWHARVHLLAAATIGGYLVLLTGMLSSSWGIAATFAAGIGLIVYGNIKLITICHSCGQTVLPNGLLSPASFCSRCGEAVVPSPLREAEAPTV